MNAAVQEIALGKILTPISREETPSPRKTYRQLGVHWWGKGAYERDAIEGSRTKASVFKRFAAGEVVINKIWALHGAVAVVPRELDGLYGSTEFPCFVPDTSQVAHRWLHWVTQWPAFWERCADKSRGTSGKSRIRPERFLEVEIPLPDLPEQERLAARLDALSARLAEARRLHDALADEQEELLMSFAKEIAKDAPREPMQEVAPLVRRPVNVKPKALYPEIGVRSFGRGTFHKAPLRGSDITWKTIFHIEPGDLIFSNLMAWEGAVAVAKPADAGFVGSYRFLSCVPKPEKATPEFLCQWFLTEEGIFQLQKGSPSSIKRNRTLSKTNLMAIPVPVPPLPKQKEFTALRRQIQSARALHADLPAELDALQSALLDKAFRGEL